MLVNGVMILMEQMGMDAHPYVWLKLGTTVGEVTPSREIIVMLCVGMD